MKTVAVVPVKHVSERVENKNFRVFAEGKSLLEWKLSQLVTAECFDEIFVSSDSPTAQKTATSYGASFIERSAELCSNDVPWSDVIYHVVSSLPVSPTDTVAWCHTTSPLFTRYAEALNTYDNRSSQVNGLVSVKNLTEFILDRNTRPLNYHWGVWHTYSQKLDPLCAVTGALFISSKEEMQRTRYVISSHPMPFITSMFEAQDLDTEYDFRLAQIMWEQRDFLQTL